MAWRFSTDSNEEMVKSFKSSSTVTTKAVENAFLSVPRAAFLPESLQDEAYTDSPIRGDDHLHMSAPHMYATVLEALELEAGMSFLNIGSGTGYFSMLAGFIIGSQGINHGIEIQLNLVEHANECCDEFFMYMPKMKKKICHPLFIVGNCFHVDPLAHKYDRVYCGAACPRIKFPFLLQLLKPGGFIVVPSSDKLLKLIRVSPHGVNETILSEVCFESLVLPETDQHCPKLRFPSLKVKAKKIKVYPPPGLLVSKTSARKSLARLRALQDVVDCFTTESRRIPEAFTYVPSFTQLRQLTENPKSSAKDQAQPPVDQTVDFFSVKALNAKESALSNAARNTENAWSDLQNDTIWESVVDYTYSLCISKDQQNACLQVYTKNVKRKKMRKLAEVGLGDSKLSKHIAENLEILMNKTQLLKEALSTGARSNDCNVLKRSFDGRGIAPCSNNSEERLSDGDAIVAGDLCEGKKNQILLHYLKNKFSVNTDLSSCSKETKKGKDKTFSATIPCTNDTSDLSKKSGVDEQTKLNDSADILSKSLEPGCSDIIKNSEGVVKQHKCKGGVQSNMESLISHQRLCPIEIDEYFMNELGRRPGPRWTSDEDIELVLLLINSLSSGKSKITSKSLTKHIFVRPSLFSPSVLVPYPKLSLYSHETLAFRALVLFRVVHVIDSVLPFLCSSSPAIDSVTKPLSERPYPLASFNESSFSSQKSSSQSSKGFPVNGEADIFLTSGIENNRKQKEFILKKLALLGCWKTQFETRDNILKQIPSVEEQNVVLQHVPALERSTSSGEVDQLQQTQHERNSTPHELLRKQSKIAQEKLQVECETAQLNVQMGILIKEEVTFAQLMKVTNKLKKVQKKFDERECECRKGKDQPSVAPVADKRKNLGESKHRYNASAIMTSLRFLLPLSNRRMGIISELLRATEQPVPDQLPVVYVDRQVSVSERLSSPNRSVFYQIYEELKAENISFRWNKRKCDQWWEVKFIGEGIIDQGGGFRDSLTELSDELCPQGPNIKHILPLFVKSVNQRDQVGEYCDCFVPNPSCKEMKIFHWLGKLMGAAYRSDESLTLSFPPFVWKLLAGEHVNWCTDFSGVDAISVNLINNIEVASEEDFSKLYASDLDFTTVFSDGSVVEVKDGGSQMHVNYDDRLEYCELVKKSRMMETINQVKAMCDGLLSVIPKCILELITSQELERGVCGFNEISISLLKESIHYGDELTSNSECVIQLWKVLESFTMEDRSRFLRFVTGRKRLPACITLSQMCGEKDTLPSASTCASTLMLPSYSSIQVAEKKLRYAIYNCIAIDTDTSPW